MNETRSQMLADDIIGTKAHDVDEQSETNLSVRITDLLTEIEKQEQFNIAYYQEKTKAQMDLSPFNPLTERGRGLAHPFYRSATLNLIRFGLNQIKDGNLQSSTIQPLERDDNQKNVIERMIVAESEKRAKAGTQRGAYDWKNIFQNAQLAFEPQEFVTWAEDTLHDFQNRRLLHQQTNAFNPDTVRVRYHTYSLESVFGHLLDDAKAWDYVVEKVNPEDELPKVFNNDDNPQQSILVMELLSTPLAHNITPELKERLNLLMKFFADYQRSGYSTLIDDRDPLIDAEKLFTYLGKERFADLENQVRAALAIVTNVLPASSS